LYDEEFTITPFDPNAGICFKYGRVYTDRNRQIADFEKATGYRLPSDFLEMVREYCEGGFDGYYRVYFQNGVEIQWHHLLLMKLADDHDTFGHDALKLIRARPELFGKPGEIRMFPFGEACKLQSPNHLTKGHMAFDASHDNRVMFVPESGGKGTGIAGSFREMMLGSSFVFYG
jgi:hypothetical protein